MVAPELRFGRFELQAHERRLLAEGQPVPLGARAFDLLLALAERAGQLVHKSALIDLVWPGLVVQENNLAAQVSALRKALGDGVIATIPGRGYRFVARLEPVASAVSKALPEGSHGGQSAADVGSGADPAGGSGPGAFAPGTLRTNLPAELSALIGRGGEIAVLAELIDQHRLVSVVGPGGVGKSLLCQHVLAARRSRYPHGVCWVELGAVREAAALPAAVAAALGLEAGHGDPMAALASAVSTLTMLLALDNAEHLLDDVAALGRALLDAAPGLRLLVTSQAPLRLAAEQVLRVEPLAVPATPLPAAQALRYGAVALFAERARAVDRRFEVNDANAAAVIDVCRALDGLPLALELAAARAPLIGPAQLLQRMEQRFALLGAGRNRAAPARQRTLRAALEWSHELLPPREQRVFRRLGVFAGSVSLELLLAVLADGSDAELDTWSVLESLDALVDRSLVAVLVGDDAFEPRYRLLDTPRAFALEALVAGGEHEALRARHAHALAALFDAAYEHYFEGRTDVDEWLRRREPEFDNAREALRFAREAGDAALELRIASTMLRALPPSLHDERMALARACEARVDALAPGDAALALKVWLELNCVLADPYKARGRLAAEQALGLARQRGGSTEGDRFVLYHALSRAASAAAQADDLSAAGALIDELRSIEDPAWPAHRLLWGVEAQMWRARMSGDRDGALVLGRRLLMLDRERGSHASIAIGNLIDSELAAGHADAAARLGAELVESLQRTRHEYSLAFARINLLAARLALGDLAQARPVAQAAWASAPSFALQHAAAAYLALLCALDGRHDAAARLAAYSAALYAARGEVREWNETDATERALALARERLDAPAFDRAVSAGAALRDADVAALAFGPGDAQTAATA